MYRYINNNKSESNSDQNGNENHQPVQCVGPCYPANTKAIHPIYFELITDNIPFCPILEWIYTGPNKIEHRIITDKCNDTTSINDVKRKERISMLLPEFHERSSDFLFAYYNINSFESALDWIENNKHSHLRTRERIIGIALKVYMQEITIVDFRFVNFFIELLNHQMDMLYSELGPELTVVNGTVKPGTDSDKEMNTNRDLKISYISKTFLNKDQVYRFLSRYIEYNKSVLLVTSNILERMTYDYVLYIKKKIDFTIKSIK